ncbi:hypothetical protein BJ912DRAFT_936587 [Pholiota molesta]|nr:hypothetical protein BJ912DRAFT_936587 [Pholiota molesta]
MQSGCLARVIGAAPVDDWMFQHWNIAVSAWTPLHRCIAGHRGGHKGSDSVAGGQDFLGTLQGKGHRRAMDAVYVVRLHAHSTSYGVLKSVLKCCPLNCGIHQKMYAEGMLGVRVRVQVHRPLQIPYPSSGWEGILRVPAYRSAAATPGDLLSSYHDPSIYTTPHPRLFAYTTKDHDRAIVDNDESHMNTRPVVRRRGWPSCMPFSPFTAHKLKRRSRPPTARDTMRKAIPADDHGSAAAGLLSMTAAIPGTRDGVQGTYAAAAGSTRRDGAHTVHFAHGNTMLGPVFDVASGLVDCRHPTSTPASPHHPTPSILTAFAPSKLNPNAHDTIRKTIASADDIADDNDGALLVFVPNQKRKGKRLVKKEHAWAEKEREAFMSDDHGLLLNGQRMDDRANHDPLEVVEASVTESESVTSSGRRRSQIQYTPKAANTNNPAIDNLPPQGIAEATPEPVDQPNEIMQEADRKRLLIGPSKPLLLKSLALPFQKQTLVVFLLKSLALPFQKQTLVVFL